ARARAAGGARAMRLERLALGAAIALLLAAPDARASNYRYPLGGCHGGCAVVSAYFDRDGGGGIRDWNCGSVTYDGHRGTDFAIIGGFTAQDAGRTIVAAAPGRVVQSHDGEFDRCTSGACSGGGGLGNYVAIQHADGRVTYYGHMRRGSVRVGVGADVTCGQALGLVGSSGMSTGPHLHFDVRSGTTRYDPFSGGCGAPSGSGWVSQGGYRGLPGEGCAAPPPPPNRPPEGYLDVADCKSIGGWARDPDDPARTIAVHVYIGGPAGDPGAKGFPLTANRDRSDLCQPLGSCNHAFSMRSLYGFHDGVARPVYAYGIDSAGGANAQLASSPRTLRCDPPTPPVPADRGVRRHVPSMAVFDRWRFSGNDVAKLAPATLESYPRGPELPEAPVLIQAEGDGAVYLKDGTSKRHVPSPDAMEAWGFDWKAIQKRPPAEVAGLLTGAPLFARPFVAQGSGPDVYVVDAAPPLWAQHVEGALPGALYHGERSELVLTFRNRGGHTWKPGETWLAPAAPRDHESLFCDPERWSDCTRAASSTVQPTYCWSSR
ncbi:MAG: M23 family metallopeptidase, partial [Myxococcales bacterium]